MSIECIKEDCRKLLTNHNLPVSYLDKQIDVHLMEKKWICDSLGFNEENDFRVRINIDASLETRPEMRTFLEYLSLATGRAYIPHDISFMAQGKNLVKISKVISEGWDAMISHCEARLEKDAALGREVFVKLYLKARGDGDIIHRFLCSFGDLTKSNRVVSISVNPYDFLTSAGKPYCAYDTCIRIDGEYFNTVFDYMSSNCVIISYVSEKTKMDYKIGRQFVYLSDDAIAQTRYFGAISELDASIVRDHIIKKLGGVWTRRAGAPNGDDFSLGRTPYIDMQGHYHIRDSSRHKRFVIKIGVCLHCGKLLSKSQGRSGVCQDCFNLMRPCAHCGKIGMIDAPHRVIGGRTYCATCYESYTVNCGHCHVRIAKSESFKTMSHNHLCNTCFMLFTEVCSGCLMHYDKTIMRRLNNVPLCPDCIVDRIICTTCKDVVHRYNAVHTIEGLVYCFRCYVKRRKKDAPK
jgi:hypothetical protein